MPYRATPATFRGRSQWGWGYSGDTETRGTLASGHRVSTAIPVDQQQAWALLPAGYRHGSCPGQAGAAPAGPPSTAQFHARESTHSANPLAPNKLCTPNEWIQGTSPKSAPRRACRTSRLGLRTNAHVILYNLSTHLATADTPRLST